jgi:hypothetical protein
MNRRNFLIKSTWTTPVVAGSFLSSCEEGRVVGGFVNLFADGADFIGFDGKKIKVSAKDVAETMARWEKEHGSEALAASIVAIGVGRAIALIPNPAARVVGVRLEQVGRLTMTLVNLNWEEIAHSIVIEDEKTKEEILSQRELILYRGDGKAETRAIDKFSYENE